MLQRKMNSMPCVNDLFSTYEGITRGKCTHLDIEVRRIREDGANSFHLRLHVHFLNLAIFKAIAVG